MKKKLSITCLVTLLTLMIACHCGEATQPGTDQNSVGDGNTSVGEGVGGCAQSVGNVFEPAQGFDFIIGTALFAPASVPKPNKCTPITDTHFGTRITRITNTGEYAGPGIENEYARSDPENSDGTHLLLRANNGDWLLYNAHTFEMISQLTGLIEQGGEELEPRWDATDPNVFYYVDGTLLRSYNVATHTPTTLRDFRQDFPNAAYVTTKTEGDASLDRRYWCLLVENTNMVPVAVVVYDKNSNTLVGIKTSFKDGINWVSMDMSGSHCVIGYEDSDNDGDEITPPAEAFSRDFATATVLPTGANGHMDLALTRDGRDVMVYQNNSTDFIEMADLTTGTATPLLAIPFGTNSDIGIHVSGNSSATPGWALISTYGAKVPPEGQTHSWMDNQVFLLELTASPRIWRLAHTHAYTSDGYNPDQPVNYFAEAFATINKSGTKIFFGSNWDIFTDIEYTDAYQINLPSHWYSTLSP
ncbi:MAG: hypothetical protein ACD_62C00214G0002 [uncultured bacterium]|nr:MAG: hypothetical protein ACD_62C00214G0002 [uncultured bacterium]